MTGELPRASEILQRWLTEEESRNFEGLHRRVSWAITQWEAAARTFNIKPATIADPRYWELKDLAAKIKDLDQMHKRTYVVNIMGKAEAVDG